jgi:carboxylesterase
MHKTLKRCGVETHSLTLPGHGLEPEALVDVRAEDWLEAVTAKYREIVDQYDTLHVIGMCMGSLLAALLCARERHIKGRLITLAPPVYIDGWSTPWYRGARKLLYRLPLLSARMKVEEGEPYGIKNNLVRNIVKAKFERGDKFHYRWVPLACIREVDRLRALVKRAATKIACPLLVVHAREDELTSLRSAEFLAQTVPDARVVVLENSYHLVCIDNDRELVASSVLEFLGVVQGPARVADTVLPCSVDEMASLVTRYVSAMQQQRYEDLFPLFASDVRWDQGGANPLARVYDGRNALIDLFSQFMALSGDTFTATAFSVPHYTNAEAQLTVSFAASNAHSVLETSGVLTFGFGNGRIRTVNYRPSFEDKENVFWSAAAQHAASGVEPGVKPRVVPDASLASLRGDALHAAFDEATRRIKALPKRPTQAVLLRLYALYRQSRSGDATGDRPGLSEIVARAKYDAWLALRGVNPEAAMRDYVALVRELTGT